MRLLLAEDEHSFSRALGVILNHNNYSVDIVDNGNEALDYGLTNEYDGIILDIMMPGKDGLTVLKELRENNIDTPIIMLTAKGEVEDRIQGLDLGADDYLPKPFDTNELLARVRAITRRKSEFQPDILSMANISLDKHTSELTSDTNKSVRLTSKEFQMLEMMLLNPKIIISAERFLEHIWGYNTDSEINVVWTYISILRRKLAQVEAKLEIKAVRGMGYTLVDKTEEEN